MAADLSLPSLTHPQKLALSHHTHQAHCPNPSSVDASWMWNPKQAPDDDDSWEVRAFAEDTGNIMGTTWPPRSYTCTFCRREFRSAQALGGHMNVHRRDRARLHQAQPGPTTSSSPSSSGTLIIPAQEFVANGGLCLLYQLPNPNATVFSSPTPVNACVDSPSTLLSISPFPPGGLVTPCTPAVNFPAAPPPASIDSESKNNKNNTAGEKDPGTEELDLELRLGHRPSPPS